MPEFIYIGDGFGSPAYTKIKEIPFELNGRPVNVEDPHIVGKLRGNPTFRELVGGKAVEPPSAPEVVKDWIKPKAADETEIGDTAEAETDEKQPAAKGKGKA